MTAWHPLEIPVDFRSEGRKAPLAAPAETAHAYRRALVKLIDETRVPVQALEAGLSTAAALLEGAQGFIGLANDLVRPDAAPEQMRAVAADLLRTVGALLSQRRSAYAIHQMAGVIASGGVEAGFPVELPRISRLRGYMTPLELALERVGVERHLEAKMLALLCVHLDDFYDDCALQLARLFHALGLEQNAARAVAPDFLRRLYADFAHASFADHLLAEHERREPAEEPDDPSAPQAPEGSGLLGLLPRLTQALDSL